MSALADRIAAVARMLGDDELIALANRGLVRRARKDLESAKPEVLDETAAGVSLRWDQQTVVLAERPAESRCTCPAGGICRHILACLLHLGSAPATGQVAASAPKPSGAEITALPDEELERWAGKAMWKRARRELAIGLSVACEDGAPFIGRIAEWNAECRWMPGGGLGGMLCSCHEPGVCVHRVAVVLAWQVQQGRRTIEREDAVPEASSGAVRTRPEVCEEVAALCEDLVSLGFSRTGPTHAERFRTMAMAAHGVDLPRLERLVRGLAQEIDGWLSRDPQASDARLLERTAACWALSKALTKPTPELVGVHRSQYERVHNLELVGAGLEAWKTLSGYQGLSVYFWDQHNRSWCTWSEVRPVTTAEFDPMSRAAAPGPWPGATSPTHISTASGVLMGAWRNRAQRLSGRPASRWHAQHATTIADLPTPTADWRDLWTRLPDLCPIGFADRKVNSDIVLVRPAKWLPAQFDTHRQLLVRGLVDVGGRQIPIIIPQSAHTQAAISQVESLPDAADRSLLARLQITADGISLHPISLVDPAGIRSLTQADKPTPPSLSVPAQEDDGLEEDTDDETMPLGSSPVLDRCLDACLALGNAGMRSFRQWPLVTAAASEARGLGLGSLSAALARLVEAQGRGRAEVLLLSTWILTCQRQAMQVAACQHEVEHG
ncbi:MAG: SWIM zinc finger domain-containing protein [Planctomycetes bacterium]|nr:SWIM zinc finger domain-containing protein [Planctomycetota bacterium]